MKEYLKIVKEIIKEKEKEIDQNQDEGEIDQTEDEEKSDQ
jgi:hypothetical protein